MKITNKENEVLNILWEAERPLNAKQICDINKDMVKSTVQGTLKKLLDKNLIEVKDIIYSGTVLSRTYEPTLSQEAFISKQYKNLSVAKFVNYLLENNETDEVDEVFEYLARKRQERRD